MLRRAYSPSLGKTVVGVRVHGVGCHCISRSSLRRGVSAARGASPSDWSLAIGRASLHEGSHEDNLLDRPWHLCHLGWFWRGNGGALEGADGLVFPTRRRTPSLPQLFHTYRTRTVPAVNTDVWVRHRDLYCTVVTIVLVGFRVTYCFCCLRFHYDSAISYRMN